MKISKRNTKKIFSLFFLLLVSGLFLCEKVNAYTDAEISNLVSNEGYIPITTADELNGLRNNTENFYGLGTEWEGSYTAGIDKKYVQTADIDMTLYPSYAPIAMVDIEPPPTDPEELYNSMFQGVYDGAGFEITHLNEMLFGFVGIDGKVKNISIPDAIADGSKVSIENPLSGLLNVDSLDIRGFAVFNFGEISNCRIYGRTEASSTDVMAGIGIAFMNQGLLEECSVDTENIAEEGDTGMLGMTGITVVNLAPIEGSPIDFSSRVGELKKCFAVQRTTIASTNVVHLITDMPYALSGLTAINFGIIEDSYIVFDTDIISGVTGFLTLAVLNFGDIKRTYLAGDVSGEGVASISTTIPFLTDGFGGLESSVEQAVADSFYSSDSGAIETLDLLAIEVEYENWTQLVADPGAPFSTEEIAEFEAGQLSFGGAPRTNEELRIQNTFVNWDFENVWDIDEGVDYPVLEWTESTLKVEKNWVQVDQPIGFTVVVQPTGSVIEPQFGSAAEVSISGPESEILALVGDGRGTYFGSFTPPVIGEYSAQGEVDEEAIEFDNIDENDGQVPLRVFDFVENFENTTFQDNGNTNIETSEGISIPNLSSGNWTTVDGETMGVEEVMGTGTLNTNETGEYMKVDSEGFLNVVWSEDGDIYFKRWDGSMWVNAAGEESVGEIISESETENIAPQIHLDSSDNPYIIWSQVEEGEFGGGGAPVILALVKISKWNGSDWVNMDGETLGSETLPARMLDGSLGEAKHINLGEFFYASFLTGLPVPFKSIKFFFDNNNLPVVVWDNTILAGDVGEEQPVIELMLTRWNGSNWTGADETTPIPDRLTNFMESFKMAMNPEAEEDSEGNIHIVWSDLDFAGGGSPVADVGYMRWNGSEWTNANEVDLGKETLTGSGEMGFIPKIMIDNNQRPIVTWEGIAFGGGYPLGFVSNLHLTRWNGSEWTEMDSVTAGIENISNTPEQASLFHRVLIDEEDGVRIVWSEFSYDTESESEAMLPVLVSENIAYTEWNGSEWVNADGVTTGIENINTQLDLSGYETRNANFTLDSDSNPIVAMTAVETGTNRDELFFTRWDGTTWEKSGDDDTIRNLSNDESVFVLSPIFVPVPEIIFDTLNDSTHISFTANMDERQSLYATSYYQPEDEIDQYQYQSLGIKTIGMNLGEVVSTATFFAEDETPGESRVIYYISNDGGITWNEIVKGEEFTFNSNGEDLRWKAELFRGSTPTINKVGINFNVNQGSTTTTPNTIPTPEIKDIFDITKDSLRLKVEVASQYQNQELDFVIEIEDGDRNKTKEKLITKKVDGDGKVTLFVDKLHSGTKYKFKVKFAPHGQAQFSEFSKSKTASTKQNIEKKDCTPKNLMAVAISSSQINLFWKDECDEENGYYVERKVTGGEFEQIAALEKNTEFYQDMGLTPKTEYTYRVRGHEGNRFTDYSNEALVSTKGIDDSEEEEKEFEGKLENKEDEHEGESEKEKSKEKKDAPFIQGGIEDDNLTPSVDQGERPIITKEAAQKAAEAVGIVGLLAGLPTFIFQLLGIFGKPKDRKKMGIIFDKETRIPIKDVSVSIVNSGGKTIETVSTDAEGRYVFLVEEGVYTLQINKKGYSLSQARERDEFYGELYIGNSFEILKDKIVHVNVAMKNEKAGWRDFSRRKMLAYTSFFSIVKGNVFATLFYVGLFATLVALFLSPSTFMFNAVILGFYVIVFVCRLLIKIKNFGMITNSSNEPIPFSVVTLYDERNLEERLFFTVSDVLGRYCLFVDNGSYVMKIQGKESNKEAFSKALKISVSNGVVKKDVVIE